MRHCTAVLALVVAAAGPSRAQEEPAPRGPGLLICTPNAPGSRRAALPIMERLGGYLGRKLGRDVRPVYFNELGPATAWLEDQRPAFGILSLAVYLRWHTVHGARAIALSERSGRDRERYFLLVRKDHPAHGLDELGQGKPAVLWSSHLDDRRFAANVVFARKLRIGPSGRVRLKSTRQPLRALRRMKAGRPFEDEPVDGVVVDETTWSGLQKLRSFQGALRVLYASPALPTPPVVAFPGVGEEERDRLREALVSMPKDPEGARLLQTLQATGFRPVDEAALAEALAAYERGLPE